MAILNITFPTRVSDGSQGGPEFNDTVLEYQSGFESTNKKWPHPRMRYSINANTLDQDEIKELWDFWMVAGGRANSFLFDDPYDYQSCDFGETLAASDQIQLVDLSVAVTSVQLIKTYVYGGVSYVRNIYKPDLSTVVFMVDGSTRTTGFTGNASTGVFTFSPALASTVASVRAGYQYKVHVRFDIRWLPVTFQGGLIGNARVPLVEKLQP